MFRTGIAFLRLSINELRIPKFNRYFIYPVCLLAGPCFAMHAILECVAERARKASVIRYATFIFPRVRQATSSRTIV